MADGLAPDDVTTAIGDLGTDGIAPPNVSGGGGTTGHLIWGPNFGTNESALFGAAAAIAAVEYRMITAKELDVGVAPNLVALAAGYALSVGVAARLSALALGGVMGAAAAVRMPALALTGALGAGVGATPAQLTIPYQGGFLNLTGESGANATTPDDPSLDITADIDIRGCLALNDWTPPSLQVVLAKAQTGTTFSFALDVIAAGNLRLAWSVAGTTVLTADSTVAVGGTDGVPMWVRATMDVDNGSAQRVITFYTSTDPVGTAPASVTWTPLGAAVTTAGTTSIFSSTSQLEVGSFNNGVNNRLVGRVYYAEVRNGIGGTVVASPDFRSLGTGTTSFTDATGKVWTINGTATFASSGAAVAARLSALQLVGLMQAGESVAMSALVAQYAANGVGAQMGLTYVANYANAGTFTFVVPPGVTALKNESWAAGGGSGAGSTSSGGGGGGGGAYSRTNASTVAAADSLTLLVGAGGGAGIAGSDSSVKRGATTFSLAKGGGLGGAGGVGSGGTGGTGGAAASGTGDNKFSGGNGAAGAAATNGGGGGGGAGDANAGANGVGSNAGAGGTVGGGNGGAGSGAATAGVAGNAAGGGAGGGGSLGAGAAGAKGRVQLTMVAA